MSRWVWSDAFILGVTRIVKLGVVKCISHTSWWVDVDLSGWWVDVDLSGWWAGVDSLVGGWALISLVGGRALILWLVGGR